VIDGATWKGSAPVAEPVVVVTAKVRLRPRTGTAAPATADGPVGGPRDMRTSGVVLNPA